MQLLITAVLAGFVVQATELTPAPAPQAPAPPTISAAASARPHADLAGTWNYNETESVNAATGKPETARAANERRGVGRGPTAPRPIGADASAPADGRASRPIVDPSEPMRDSMYYLMIEQRDTLRDLMEIAPWIRIDVAPASVTIADDLDRVLVFPVDGKKQRYQLGAALFDARTVWDGGQLKMDIEGPDGLKMSQTWFLNDDGSKLFQIIRLADVSRDGRPVGVNRVYDRTK